MIIQIIQILKRLVPRMVAFIVAFKVAGMVHRAGDDFMAFTILIGTVIWYTRWCLSVKLPAGQSR